MAEIDPTPLAQLVLTNVSNVTFYKRDELTTDLICCDVTVGIQLQRWQDQLQSGEGHIAHR